ncbi:MAG: glycosyltransferase, partial [Leifsonia flava]
RMLPPEVQLVLCAGAPDTQAIMDEVSGLVRELQQERTGVVWIDRLLPQPELSAVLTAGTAFVCPSVYEPLGIVNLEAMACGLPVVGTATGGIPEVVDNGVTGRLVPIEQLQDGTGTPIDPERFVADLAEALTAVVSDPEAAARMGAAGRDRAEREFGWDRIAASTREIYASLIS